MQTQRTVARVGDWIEIQGHTLGEQPRRAMVLEVLGAPGHEHYHVRWDEEHESILFPAEDARIVPREDHAAPRRTRSRSR